MRTLFALALLAVSTPALAEPEFDAPTVDRPTSERVSDGFGMGLSAGGGAVIGAFAGGTIAALTCPEDDGSFGFGCLGRAALGFGLGSIGGFLGGALIFDGVSDGDGSLWATAGGAVLGLAGGTWLATIDDLDGIGWVTIPVLTAVGAGFGYALFDSAPAVPSVAILPDGQGGTHMAAALSGRF